MPSTSQQLRSDAVDVPPRPPFVRTRQGVDFFVRDWGSGAPILFMAGWAMTSGLWGLVKLNLNARRLSHDRL